MTRIEERIRNCPHFRGRIGQSIMEAECGLYQDFVHCEGENCPYIANPEEHITLSVGQVQRRLEELLPKHIEDGDVVKAVIDEFVSNELKDYV